MQPFGPQGPQPFLYQPTRRTQPYRDNGQRNPSMALQAMQQGRTAFGQNPMDFQRAMQTARPGSLLWHLLNLSAGGRTMGQ